MRAAGTYVADQTVHEDYTSAEENSVWYEGVLGPGFVKILCQRPGCRVGIVRLHVCAAPGRVTIAVDEKLAVSIHDGDHDDVVDEAA